MTTPESTVSELSRDHLASTSEAAALLKLEFAFMRSGEAFANWVAELHRRTGGAPLAFREVALLHSIRLCGPPQTLAELRVFTNAHALPRLRDGLRRLERAGFVSRRKPRGEREARYALTQSGASVTEEYARLRSASLVEITTGEVGLVDKMLEASVVLERLVGLYRQATQMLAERDLFPADHPVAGHRRRVRHRATARGAAEG